MDFEQTFTELMPLTEEQQFNRLQEVQASGAFENGQYKEFLLYIAQKKSELAELSEEAKNQADSILAAMMMFQAFYLSPADLMELFDPNTDLNKHDDPNVRIHELNELTGQAVALKNQAVQQRSIAGLHESLQLHMDIITELQTLNVPDLLARNYYQAAIIQKRLEQYDEAIANIERATSILEAAGRTEQVMSYRVELAKVYIGAKRHREAYGLFLELRDYYQQQPADDCMVFICDGLAELHWIRNERENEYDIQQGMQYLLEAVMTDGILMYPGLAKNCINTFELYKEFRCYGRVLENCVQEANLNKADIEQRLQGYAI